MRRMKWVGICGCLAFATAIDADVVTLTPSKDNSLYEDSQGALSNGAGAHLFVGTTSARQTRRALLGFDLTGSIPAGATVTSVSLTMNMSRTIASAKTVQIRRVLSDWGEATSAAGGNEGAGGSATAGDATWVHTFFDSEQWDAQGGDFSAEVSASLSVSGTGSYTWTSTPMLVADVQFWLDSPSANFGWILIGNEGSDRTAKRFDSRENSNASNRPELTVEFTPEVVAMNAAPTVANSIEDRNFVVGEDAAATDLNGELPVFADADGDTLSYTVDSSDSTVATAAISGSTLTVTAVEEGSATITVSAADPEGETVSTSFAVVVAAGVTPILGDFNGDEKVDLLDFFAFAGHFGNTSESEDWDPIFDLVPSGVIDLTDFFFFAQTFGNTN